MKTDTYETYYEKLGTKQGLISFYQAQLHKFSKVRIGNQTEFGVTVTDSLINITKKRLSEIKSSLTPVSYTIDNS